MKMQIRVLFLALLINFLLLSSAFAETQYELVKEPLSEFELGRYQYCGADKDCMVVNNGCCDCANGGKDVAINKERLQAFKSRFDCIQVVCTQLAAEQLCGSGLLSCINHKCKYFESKEAIDVPLETE